VDGIRVSVSSRFERAAGGVLNKWWKYHFPSLLRQDGRLSFRIGIKVRATEIYPYIQYRPTPKNGYEIEKQAFWHKHFSKPATSAFGLTGQHSPVIRAGSFPERFNVSIYGWLDTRNRTFNSHEILQAAGAANDFDSIVKLAVQNQVTTDRP
jgi:hypothetical protein